MSDEYERELIKSCFEQPQENIIICYLVPNDSTFTMIRGLFRTISHELLLRVKEKDPFTIIAEYPINVAPSIVMSIKTHPIKGYIAILKYKFKMLEKIRIQQNLSANAFSCDANVLLQDCHDFLNCKIHCDAGIIHIFNEFFKLFKQKIIDCYLTYRPPVANLLENAKNLTENYWQTGYVSFNEKRVFYVTVPPSAIHSNRQFIVEVLSTKKVNVTLRYNQPPTLFGNLMSINPVKFDDHFKFYSVLSKNTNPKLTSGTLFIAIRGNSIFNQSFFRISVKFASKPKLNILDEGDGEDGWVIVADESSAAGRNEKVQILKDFSNVSLVINNPSAMNRINKRRNSYFSTSSSDEYYSSCELNESYRSSLSNSIPNSNRMLDFIDLGSNSIEDKEDSRLSDPPPQFLCPITREIMTQPVIAADGHSYELNAIEHWLQTHIRSPMTGEEMPHKILIANYNLRSQIEDWNQSRNPFSQSLNPSIIV